MAGLDPEKAVEEMLSLGLTPLEPYPGSGKPWRSLHTCGRESSPRLAMARRGVAVCKFCGIEERTRQRRTDEGDAVALMVKAGVKPLVPFVSFKEPWKCECLTCHEIVTPNFGNVRNGHAACKYCAHKAITLEKANSLALAAGAIPIEPYPGDFKKKWLCKCANCGAEVTPRLGDLVKGQGCCRDCGYLLSAEANRISNDEAYESMVNGGMEPLEEYPGSVETPWLSRCMECGELGTPRLHSIRAGQRGCVPCGIKASSQKKLRNSSEVEQIMLNANLKPLVPYPGAKNGWKSLCLTCGETVSPSLANVQNGSKCTKCSRREAAEKMRTPEAVAVEEMRRAGFEPQVPFETTTTAWKCLCTKCGHVSSPQLASIRGGRGCIFCSRQNRTPEPGQIVYLLYREDFLAYKIGVGNETRLKRHKLQGWDVTKTWLAPSVQDAYRLERDVLSYVREILQLPIYLGREQMPQGGFTETFSADSITIPKLIDLVEQLRTELFVR